MLRSWRITPRKSIVPKQFRNLKWLRFNRTSFTLFAILFAIVVIIALFFRDDWIRPLLGDVLIVMVIAYFVHAFIAVPLRKVAIGTLIFAYLIEFLQFLNLIDILGWRNSRLAHLTIGSTFDWRDLAAYTLGIAIILLTANRLKS
ncbi:DUF2809 domain-containing protein [Nostoc sp. PCC 7120 = FACHB-418]|uniref:DUF2809 domain-containing protein n=2 Tax=Nostocaceae TaxID=1162 RepID=A0A1Z4KEM4_ANAVA|nr:DUF2809 domain-containing protein [Nostoc sp. PCC 7120 = FACHB-418]MBD2173378.1 DUF2809 domain-containing protein [Anabaena cylindrica FACHB-318]MBD2265128.1 DUF2809 domain-containing protein [Anabaena sp. FACHB-709]MBD2285370.1 DUF2809 domain-containing protein [Anabaena cylindrica FACHB-170]MBD2350764.1 DUF2809 domain-containing protein [Trichormus variabilis FACHB-171]BAY67438.1 hypothetical protein NIES23_02110 [Trichormus variabilis NIES-23]HBW30922.1 DUF2809 domain-containing protein